MNHQSPPATTSEAGPEPGTSRKATVILAPLLFGLLAAIDVTLAILEVNYRPLLTRDAAFLFVGLLGLVGMPCALAFWALVAALSRRASARRWNPVSMAAAVLLAGLALVAVAAAQDDAVSIGDSLRRHLALGIFLAMLAAGGRSSRFAGPGALLAGTAFVALLALGIPGAAGVLGYVADEPPASEVEPVTPTRTGKTVLIGIDGLCWETLQRWREEGPNDDFRWLADRSYIGPLQTFVPNDSPIVWTSIATGTTPAEHGVLGFTAWDVAGLDWPLVVIPPGEGAFVWLGVCRRLGLCSVRPISALDVRRPPLWEIVGRAERPVDVVAWWATWPALPLAGRLVSDKFYFWRDQAKGDSLGPGPSSEATGLTYPPQAELELTPLRVPPSAMTVEQILSLMDIPEEEARELAGRPYHHHDALSEVPLAFTMDETHYRVARKLLGGGAPGGASFFYLRGVDIVSHSAMRFSNLYPETPGSQEARDRYGELISRYYAYTFSELRRLAEAAGDDAVVLLVSDHGFQPVGDGDFNHPNAPDGVIIAMGAGEAAVDPEFRPTIYDVTPTMLWLLGYPAAKDMPGRALSELFPLIEDAGPSDRCESYGLRRFGQGTEAAGGTRSDEEMLELLRSLGYIE